MKNKDVTLFSWGYWGWGTATPILVNAVDAVEAARGFAPPLFVDIRVSRSVRAPGFRERAFEKTVGEKRYRWMKALGNKQILTHSGPQVQIVEPQAAAELLELALDASKRNQRVIFFCACPYPGPTRCHRTTVAQMVYKEACKRQIDAEVIEWPGGEPKMLELQVPDTLVKQIRGGRKLLPLPEPVDIATLAGLPWYSCVSLKSDRDSTSFLSGPATFNKGKWHLPRMSDVLDELPSPESVVKEMRDTRKEYWFDAIV